MKRKKFKIYIYTYIKNTHFEDKMIFQGKGNVKILGTLVHQLYVRIHYKKLFRLSKGEKKKLLGFLLFGQLPLTDCERSSMLWTIEKWEALDSSDYLVYLCNHFY